MAPWRATFALLFLVAAGAQDAFAADAARGKATAELWCQRCHVIGPGQQQGADAGPPFADIAANPTWRDETRLMAHLASPHPAMPKVNLTRSEVSDLIAFLATLQP